MPQKKHEYLPTQYQFFIKSILFFCLKYLIPDLFLVFLVCWSRVIVHATFIFLIHNYKFQLYFV